MTTIKEDLFSNKIIPAGQLMETLLKLPMHALHPSPGSFTARERLSNDVFDALGIAVCYAVHPHTTEVAKLSAAVDGLIKQFVYLLESITAAKPGPVLATFGVPYRNTGNQKNIEFVNRYERFVKTLPALCSAIHKACQYEPASREGWLRSMTAPATVLTVGGRMNRWRTFVRHLSWDITIELLSLKAKLATERRFHSHPLRTAVGWKHANDLWEKVFAEAAHAELLTQSGVSPTGLVPIPEGVTIIMTADRLLEVSSRFNPGAQLTKETTEKIGNLINQGQTVPEALALASAPRRFVEKTDMAGMATAVGKATVWLAEQNTNQPALQHQYDIWVNDEQLKVVRSKLSAHFSPEERALVLKALSAEATTA